MGPEPDRRPFIERVLTFLEESGQPVTSMPVISKTPIDLYKLYFCVRDKGGFEEVQNSFWYHFIKIGSLTYFFLCCRFVIFFGSDGFSNEVVKPARTLSLKKKKKKSPISKVSFYFVHLKYKI